MFVAYHLVFGARFEGDLYDLAEMPGPLDAEHVGRLDTYLELRFGIVR